MDAAEAATPLGAWASIRGYFTPATLFLVLNLVIGTIALTSRSHQRRRKEQHYHDHHHHQQGQYPAEPSISDPHQEYHYYQQQPQQYATPAPPLARTSSIMDRIRSIGLYRFRSGDFPPEYGAAPVVVEEEAAAHYARSRSEPAPVREERTRGALPKVVRKPRTEVIGGFKLQEPSSPRKAEFQEEEHVVLPPAPMRAPPPLSRTSSVLDRLRSLGLYSFLAAEQPPAAAAAATVDPAAGEKPQPHAHAQHYDRSRSEPAAREQGKKEKKQAVAEARMGKSSSTTTARKPAAAPSQLEDDCVDARAEAFIDSFRKEQVHVHHDEDDHDAVPPPPAPLARTSSVLDRLRSFGMYLRSVDPVPEQDPAVKASSQYGRSRSEPAREQGKKKTMTKQRGAAEAKVSKTSSEAAAARNISVGEDTPPPPAAEECVDARADDFINKFRQQLQLQRLNSLLNYKQQQQQ